MRAQSRSSSSIWSSVRWRRGCKSTRRSCDSRECHVRVWEARRGGGVLMKGDAVIEVCMFEFGSDWGTLPQGAKDLVSAIKRFPE